MRQNTKPESVWIIRTTGEAVRVDDAPFVEYPDTGWELSLKWAREQIADGCNIAELVRLPFGDLWVDEEGLFAEQPMVNGMATALYHSAVPTTQPIVGNAVLVLAPGHKMEEHLNGVLAALVRN